MPGTRKMEGQRGGKLQSRDSIQNISGSALRTKANG